MDRLEQMGITRWRLRDAKSPVSKGAPERTWQASDVVPEPDRPKPTEPRLAEAVAPAAAAPAAPEPVVYDAAPEVDQPQVDQTKVDQTKVDQLKVEETQPLHSNDLNWQGLAARVSAGDTCPSCATSSPILGEGDACANWLFVVDAPSSQDSQQQRLLSGRSGQLFDAMLEALNLSREQVYLSSVFKCPPSQDVAAPAQCDDLLRQQISLVNPHVVVAFGEFAAQMVIKANESLATLRATTQRCFSNDVAIVPTHGLAEVLRDPSLKAETWADLRHAYAITMDAKQ